MFTYEPEIFIPKLTIMIIIVSNFENGILVYNHFLEWMI